MGGHKDALHVLGLWHLEGKAVTNRLSSNLSQAISYLKWAVRQGSEEATDTLRSVMEAVPEGDWPPGWALSAVQSVPHNHTDMREPFAQDLREARCLHLLCTRLA